MLSVFVAALDERLRRRELCVAAPGVRLRRGAARRRPRSGCARCTGAALHNLYGPTEAAVDVTFHEVTDADTVLGADRRAV